MKRAAIGIIIGLLLGGMLAVLESAASYPSSVKSFTTKGTGDAVQAAHVNDLQDEVTAIEGGLLNGLAHTIKPLSDATYDLGTSLLQWRNLYLSGNLTLGNTALHLLDTNATHDLIIAPGSNITADRTLTVTTGDADRTLTLSGNATLNANVLTSSTLTDAGADRIAFWDDSAGDMAWLEAGSGLTISGTTLTATGLGYVLQFQGEGGVSGGSWDPADSVSHYIGSGRATTPSTSQTTWQIVPKAGTVTVGSCTLYVGGTLSSAENITIAIRLNNTSDTSITAVGRTTATSQTYTNNALSIAVVEGDRLEIKLTWPAWATNPTGLGATCQVYVG